MRIHKNILGKENLDRLVKVTQSMCEDKNTSLIQDQKDLLQDLSVWLKEIQSSSQVPSLEIIYSIFYPIAGDLNRIADVLKNDEILLLIYQVNSFKTASEASHYLLYWAAGQGRGSEMVTKFERQCDAESIREKTGQSSVNDYYRASINEALKKEEIDSVDSRALSSQLMRFVIPAYYSTAPDRLFYLTFLNGDEEHVSNFGPGEGGGILKNKYIELWGIPEDKVRVDKGRESHMKFDRSYGGGIFYTYRNDPGSICWSKEICVPAAFMQFAYGWGFRGSLLVKGPVDSILVRESRREYEALELKQNQSLDEKMAFNGGSAFSSLSSSSSSIASSHVSSSFSNLVLDHPQQVKIFIFFLTYERILKGLSADIENPAAPQVPLKTPVEGAETLEFPGVTISSFQKKGSLGFMATAYVKETGSLDAVDNLVRNKINGGLGLYNPYRMHAVRTINTKLAGQGLGFDVDKLWGELLVITQSIVDSNTAICYLENIWSKIDEFASLKQGELEPIKKQALKEAQEAVRNLMEELKDINNLVKKEQIILTM